MSDRGDSLVSEDEVDVERRRFLITTTAGVGTVGAIAAAVPFVSSLQPSERAKAVGGPIEIDISKLEPGQRIVQKWRGQYVWVLRRTAETLKALENMSNLLADPESKEPEQPEYAQNISRAINPEYLVVMGRCTHLGCSPTYLPLGTPNNLGPDWQGGFFCPCHGSKFDLAGRVYKNVPAPKNLLVPPYHFLSETLLLIGEDEGAS